MLDQVTIHQLELFLVAAKLGNFSRAAERMTISQPAFSAQIIKLEKILGSPLFERVGRRIELTEAGRVFQGYSESIISSLREGKQAVDDMREHVVGTLRIGASTTIANYIMPDYLRAFRKSYPACNVHMMVSNTYQVEQALLRNEIDMGLVEGPVTHSQQISIHLFRQDELVVVFSGVHRWRKRRKIGISDLQDEPLIIRERGSGTRNVFMEAMSKANAPLNIAMELGNTEAIKRSVEAGIGVSVISKSAVERELKEKTLFMARIDGYPIERILSVIMVRNKYISNPLKAFMDLIDLMGDSSLSPPS